MTKRIFYDGLNLSLERGTGIATYTRVLTQLARELGREVGVIYNARDTPARDPLLREITFFDERNAARVSKLRRAWNLATNQLICHLPVRPVPVEFTGAVVGRQFEDRLPPYDYVFVARDLFENARRHFRRTGDFATLAFPEKPDVLHCTYQLPLRCKSACNIYTIHDLVPLRLPFATLDDKRTMYRLLKKIAKEADHIVTVSENSKRDIVKLLGVEESRVTNTYQAVGLPPAYVARPDDIVAEQVGGCFGLDFRGYLLFFGAVEPKKNVGRMVEAYLSSGVDVPLVLVSGRGWRNENETKRLVEQRERQFERHGDRAPSKRRIYELDHVNLHMLVALIKGARAVLFPSLYEGFGLPVLESMVLGTPVVTSRESALPEVAGDAALLVNPYETDDIARAIKTIVRDDDLWAELSQRGRAQADRFSIERYRERVRALYDAVG
jgi:glycosyltransferase involved in cell wall biosynthesis